MGVSSPLLNLCIFRGNLKDENTKKSLTDGWIKRAWRNEINWTKKLSK